MKIVIVAAMSKEVDYLKEVMETKFNGYKTKKVHHFEFFIGNISNHEVIVTVSGIGKVQAGMLSSTIMDNFKDIDLIINTGISGGVRENTRPGSVVIGCNYSFADVDTTADGSRYGQLFAMPWTYYGDKRSIELLKNENIDGVIFGDILTGDKFFINYEETTELVKKYFKELKVCAFDMESAAFAMASSIYNIPFLAIRCISDIIGVENQTDVYYDSTKEASERSNKVLLRLLELLK